MARTIEAKCRLCRRIGEKLMLKGDKCITKCTIDKRNIPPGQHGNNRRRRVSDRGMQLREKQKTRFSYGVFERQFRKTFEEAAHLPGITGENLLVLLERRLDNVVFRLGFGDSRAQARQLVRHGHIYTNGHKTNAPSYLVAEGDTIQWRTGSTKNKYFAVLKDKIRDKVIPNWLTLDRENLIGKVTTLPTRADVEPIYNEQMIVEYYSR
ncbi:MAG: 30S ribosomal protein S4 [Chloroflexota bacterium]